MDGGDKTKKELNTSAAKAVVAVTAAGVVGGHAGAIVTAISESLQIAIDQFSNYSTIKTNQLFNSPELINAITEQAGESADFASLIIDIWSRHNLESSEERRKYLKSIVDKVAYEEIIDYTNFTKILLICQQITAVELEALVLIYSPDAYKYSENQSNATVYSLGPQAVMRMYSDRGISRDNGHDLDYILHMLANYGLVSESQATIGGPLYGPTLFGKVFISYVCE